MQLSAQRRSLAILYLCAAIAFAALLGFVLGWDRLGPVLNRMLG